MISGNSLLGISLLSFLAVIPTNRCFLFEVSAGRIFLLSPVNLSFVLVIFEPICPFLVCTRLTTLPVLRLRTFCETALAFFSSSSSSFSFSSRAFDLAFLSSNSSFSNFSVSSIPLPSMIFHSSVALLRSNSSTLPPDWRCAFIVERYSFSLVSCSCHDRTWSVISCFSAGITVIFLALVALVVSSSSLCSMRAFNSLVAEIKFCLASSASLFFSSSAFCLASSSCLFFSASSSAFFFSANSSPLTKVSQLP